MCVQRPARFIVEVAEGKNLIKLANIKPSSLLITKHLAPFAMGYADAWKVGYISCVLLTVSVVSFLASLKTLLISSLGDGVVVMSCHQRFNPVGPFKRQRVKPSRSRDLESCRSSFTARSSPGTVYIV